MKALLTIRMPAIVHRSVLFPWEFLRVHSNLCLHHCMQSFHRYSGNNVEEIFFVSYHSELDEKRVDETFSVKTSFGRDGRCSSARKTRHHHESGRTKHQNCSSVTLEPSEHRFGSSDDIRIITPLSHIFAVHFFHRFTDNKANQMKVNANFMQFAATR